MHTAEWKRFRHYMEHTVKRQCRPQRESLRGGPFEWLQTLSGKVFGERVGPLITRFFLEDEYKSRLRADHDFIFNRKKFELKTGTGHSEKGVFLFEQIRPQQDWDALLCIGIAGNSIEFFVMPKKFIADAIGLWRKGKSSLITPQHGGAKHRDRKGPQADTFWLWTVPKGRQQLEKFHTTFAPTGWHGPHLRELISRVAPR